MSARTIEQMLANAPEELRALAEELMGNLSEDDLAVARAISNIAIEACQGDKVAAGHYLVKVGQEVPALARLFARVGWQMIKAKNSVKQ